MAGDPKLYAMNAAIAVGENTFSLKDNFLNPLPERETEVFTRNEDIILTDMIDYIEATYSEHYVGENNIQAIDVWESLGSLETSARDTAIKYLMRYGKKDGKNVKDLKKAIHYIVLMIAATEGNTDDEY
jgi:hypothetical protein